MPVSRSFKGTFSCGLLICLVFAGCTDSQQPKTDTIVATSEQPKRVASENVVKVEAPAAEINAGASTEAQRSFKDRRRLSHQRQPGDVSLSNRNRIEHS